MTPDQIDYDALPYASLPFPQTQPARLAALAALHGCHVPAVETATVLELGCASGGNIIPLAARFPKARFEGVDLADRHIRDGNQLIEELSLKNISLRQGDISQLNLGARNYDFIICHGVFSWTPQPVREDILKICAASLTVAGLAYISYNTYPGWGLRMAVREICQRHINPGTDPITAIAEARSVLEAYAGSLDPKTPYGSALKDEIAQCVRMTDPHFQGEFLGPFNEPCYFHDFVEWAEEHGLSYVCDAAPPEQDAGSLGPLLDGEPPVITAGDHLARTQSADFVSGRKFRRSILRLADAKQDNRAHGEVLMSLHYACSMVREAEEGGTLTFRHGESRIRTNDPVAGKALSLLAEAYPETRTLDEIADVALVGTGASQPGAADRLHDALRRTIEAGHVKVSTIPLRNGSAANDRPALWPVARAQLANDMIEVSSRLHEPVALRGPVRFIAGLMDGTRTRKALVEDICKAVSEGRLDIGDQNATTNENADPARITAALDHLLQECRRSGLLAVEEDMSGQE
ncbi:methyltransferase domain-containing protein [Parvularcula marina]|uniref:methyltransferase domain-containing protein n=1 Tax=Parvularcula marina TaxID=2292771 RepID=UPI003517FF67